jgi:hypothetical protein
MEHSYEEIRKIALDILAEREKLSYNPYQYEQLRNGVGSILKERETGQRPAVFIMSPEDSEIFLEVFWDLFRQGIITLGFNNSNREFPFFRVSAHGKRIIENQDVYFFHDVSSYEIMITENIPNIDETTLIYLKETMQSFLCGCVLSSSVMLGVATEHTFLKLLETIEQNSTYSATFQKVFEQRTLLQKLNKFRKKLDEEISTKRIQLSSEIKEDLETNFLGIMAIIRNFRNESGHPTGNIISREQCYVNLNLFVPYCKKLYQLMDFFK